MIHPFSVRHRAVLQVPGCRKGIGGEETDFDDYDVEEWLLKAFETLVLRLLPPLQLPKIETPTLSDYMLPRVPWMPSTTSYNQSSSIRGIQAGFPRISNPILGPSMSLTGHGPTTHPASSCATRTIVTPS